MEVAIYSLAPSLVKLKEKGEHKTYKSANRVQFIKFILDSKSEMERGAVKCTCMTISSIKVKHEYY